MIRAWPPSFVSPPAGGHPPAGRMGPCPPAVNPWPFRDTRSAGGERGVVDDERCLQGVVLAAREFDGDGLTDVAAQVEGVLGVTGWRIDIGVGGQSGGEGSAAGAELYVENGVQF